MWWTSTKNNQLGYSFSKGLDHNKVDGGGILWGEYNIGVDFQQKFKFPNFKIISDIINIVLVD